MSSPQLMQAFDFTPEELRVNQAGQISPRQQDILAQVDTQQTLDMGCALLVFAVFGGLLFLGCALLFNVNALLASLQYVLPVLGVAVVGFVGAALVFHFRGQAERRNLPDVELLEGTITLEETAGGFNARQFLTVTGRQLRLTANMYDALKLYPEGTLFRVYYAHRFDRILSVEAESDYQTT
jgi:hypothetical protein